MGKYPRSRLNDAYSNWHYQYRQGGFTKSDYMIDIDRIWVEMRGEEPVEARPVAVFDIKEPNAIITDAQSVVYNWFEDRGLPVFIVHTTISFENFKVRRWRNGTTKQFNKAEYVNWINNLGSSIF